MNINGEGSLRDGYAGEDRGVEERGFHLMPLVCDIQVECVHVHVLGSGWGLQGTGEQVGGVEKVRVEHGGKY